MTTHTKADGLVEPDELTRRLCSAIPATACGEAPPFLFARRWRPDALLCGMEDATGPIAARIPGEFEPFEPVAGEMDRGACVHALALWIDCHWLQLQANRGTVPLGNDTEFFMLWGGVRDLLRPWLDTGEALSPEQEAKVLHAWGVAQGQFYQALVLAFPQAAQLFARDGYRDTQNPRLAKVVELARIRTGKTTRH